MTELSQIYSDKILALSASLGGVQRLSAPQASATAHSKLCGSVVTVDVNLGEDGRVSEIGLEVKACLLGQASSAVAAREAVGSTPDEIRAAGAALRKMLNADGPAPGGRWADLSVLETVRDYTPRHASAMLVFDALEDALAELETRAAPEPRQTAGA